MRGPIWHVIKSGPSLNPSQEKVALSAGVEETVTFDSPTVVFVKTDVDVQFTVNGDSVGSNSPTLTPADGWHCFWNIAIKTLKLKASSSGNVWLVYGGE